MARQHRPGRRTARGRVTVGAETPGTERPLLTLSEAASATGKHRNTIRNALDSGAFPNAAKDASGAWRVPVTDLLAAGFHLHAPTPPQATESNTTQREVVEADVVERLRAEVAELRRRVEVAEALAAERAVTLERLFAALPAMLPAQATPRRWPWSRRG